MLTVEKIKKILLHDHLSFSYQENPIPFRYLSDDGKMVHLFPSKLSEEEIILKFKQEIIRAAKANDVVNFVIRQGKTKPICDSVSKAKKYFEANDLEFSELIEFDGRKFALAGPEFLGVLAEDKNGWMDLMIHNSNAVIEIIKSNS